MGTLSDISTDRLYAIIELQTALVRSRSDLESVMRVVCEHAQRLTDATGAVVEIVDGEFMEYRATSGTLAPFLGTRLARGTSMSGLCIVERVPLASPDVQNDPRADRAAAKKVGAASMVVVPLFYAGEPTGVLKVTSIHTHAFSAVTVKILALLADVIAASMQQAREMEAAIELSLHDGLTGLLNRRAFDKQLAQEASRSARHGHSLAVVMFDLDGLKAANDKLGHAAGDDILRGASTALRGALRAQDNCYRLGGDEFAALLPDTKLDGALRAAERCAVAIAAAKLGEGRVGISAGCAQLEIDEDPPACVARADAKLYEQKRAKKSAR